MGSLRNRGSLPGRRRNAPARRSWGTCPGTKGSSRWPWPPGRAPTWTSAYVRLIGALPARQPDPMTACLDRLQTLEEGVQDGFWGTASVCLEPSPQLLQVAVLEFDLRSQGHSSPAFVGDWLRAALLALALSVLEAA